METQVKVLAKVNNQQIVVIQDGEKRVAIKPICEALGISFQAQNDKIKNHYKWSSVVRLSITTGADGKEYKMVTLPYKDIFGWLYSIDARNVNPESFDTVVKYQDECNNVLYNHFTELEEFLEWKAEKTAKAFEIYMDSKTKYSGAHRIMKDAENDWKNAHSKTINDYKDENRQMTIPFPENKKIELNQEEA